MIVTVMKSHFQKKEPKIIQYRDYNNFYEEEYRQYIISLLSSGELTRSGFDTFMNKCKEAFDIRVPIKHKYLRSNQSPFMNKEISKAIMDWTTLIIGKLPITNHFGNIANLFFPIKALTLTR